MAQDTQPGAPSVRETLSSTADGTLYLILIQVASRALTFAGNQFLLRFLSPQLLGIAVQLEIYSTFVLYFSRESLRVALQRQPAKAETGSQNGVDARRPEATQAQMIINLSYIAIGLGLPLTIGLGYLFVRKASLEVVESPFFGTSLLLYGLATIIELLSEPGFVVIQQKLLYKARAQSETWAAVIKCLTACLTAFVGHRLQWSASVLPFAAGQCAYGISVLCLYFYFVTSIAERDGFSMFPRLVETSSQFLFSLFSKRLLGLSGTFYGQMIFKQLLTQGDAIILSVVASLPEQGAFALASNYGGLIARLLFQPLEESSRNVFGKLLAKTSSNDKVGRRDLTEAVARLSGVLHLYGIIALLSCCFLPTILPLMVHILVGPRWFTPTVSEIISTYCYYIPFLAYNGILDSLVTSVATPAQLSRQSVWMAAFTVIYLALAYLSSAVDHLAARALILSNIANMTMRISWSAAFITKYLKQEDAEFDPANMAPRPLTVAFCVGTAGILWKMPLADESLGGVMKLLSILLICGTGGLVM